MENFNLYTVPEIKAEIRIDGGEPRGITLKQVPNQEGVYQATYTTRGKPAGTWCM